MSKERTLLIFIALLSMVVAVSSIVLVFRMQDTADALAHRSHLNRYLICQVLLEMHVKQPLCNDIDPPSAHSNARANRL